MESWEIWQHEDKDENQSNCQSSFFSIFLLCLNIWFDLMQSWEVSMAKHENTSSGLNASKPQCMETEKSIKSI